MDLFGLTANLIDASMLMLGKTGKFLNAKGIRACFLIEIVCLSYWCCMDIERGLIAQGISCLVSICICIYGYRKWGKKPPCKTE
jgi:hypothetical protein